MNLFHYSGRLRKPVIACLTAGLLLATPAMKGQSSFEKDYTPLVSSGSLPDEFIQTARAESEAELKNLPYGPDHNAKEQFIISNNYFLRDLLLSGDVLINDPLTKYVNKVADQLLKDQPSLRQQLHIYVTKSPDVNAYAFDKGLIFVNVGLLAQLENESQLAFILAHEITHVIKKHSVTQYIENIRLDNSASSYERGSEDRTLAKYRFSKEQESEADMEGLKMMKQTNYSIKTLNGAFDVLQYSYLPFELVDFKKSFFEDEYLKLPDTLYLKTVSDIKSNDDYDDSKSTHPNIRKRRGAIAPELKVEDEASRKKYLVSEADFKETRETARLEQCHLYLLERDYMNAIYAAYIELEKYPNNVYLKKVMAEALYNVLVNKTPGTSFRNNNVISLSDNSSLSSGRYEVPNYEKIEGASQRVYYMMDNMSAAELNAVALSYTFKAHKQFPNDAVLSALTDSLFSVLMNVNNLYLNDFSKKTKAEIKMADTVKKVATPEPDQEESKYSKIKKEQEKTEVAVEDVNFVKYAFVGLLKDEEFVSRFNKMAKNSVNHSSKTDDYASNDGTTHLGGSSKRSSGSKSSKSKKAEAPDFGISKVIFLDPFYMKVKNDHGDETVKFYESEDKQKALAGIQKKCAERLKLDYYEISTKDMLSTDIDKYNDNALLNAWLGERFKHGDNNQEMVSTSEYIEHLIAKTGTKYIAWSGVYNSKGKASRNTYFFILMDLETGDLMRFETRYTRSKDNADMITSFVYNSLMHVAHKPKA